ncbi:hypothetical protein RMATCC62417_01478 [Rhizopus microsporus]|nr:hypothetical protein RMATCC62417_01478 [Rhizopus microsporus]
MQLGQADVFHHPLAVSDTTAGNGEAKKETEHHKGRRPSATRSVESQKQRRKSINSFESRQKNDQAVQSIQDIIGDIKRIPPVSLSGDHFWKRGRRHSEPHGRHMLSKKADTLHRIEEVKEKDENEHIELVSPSEEHMTRRNRSKSVPNTLPPIEESHRKAIYPSYLNLPEALAAIRQRKLFAGVLQIDVQDSSDAHVECDELDALIYIYGSRNRNRALHGDEVAVELVNVEDMMNEKYAKMQARKFRQIPSDDDLLCGSETNETKMYPKYCGRVVCILERPKNMIFSGTLSLYRPLSAYKKTTTTEKPHASPKIIWFIPINKRLPLVAVPIKFAPAEFAKYHEEYKNRIFVGSIQRWPASSLHPFGKIEKEVGWIGELGVQSGVLMADHHIKDTSFSDTVLRAATTIPKKVTPNDRKGRRDFQKENIRIFTIGSSEKGAEVAFSVSVPEKATFEIGIHVTDVAHYVREKTTLDKAARERSYAIELVEQTIPILPSNFLESHCYLLPNRERLAFSILCRFTENGTLLHAWVGRSIVRSKGHIKHVDTDGEKSEIESDASILLDLCPFKLGKSGYPEEITRIDEADEDVLMNELLIIANIEVGQKISSRFPDQALLYRQEQPKMSAFSLIKSYFDSQCDSVHDLMNYGFPKSKFFSAGSADIAKYKHFMYGAPLYALFTEPTRGQQETDNFDAIDKVARHCNATLAAKHSAEQESKRLYTAAFIYRQSLKDMRNKNVEAECLVVGFQAPDIMFLYFPTYDLELPVACNEKSMPGHASNKGIYDADKQKMTLTWHSDKNDVQTVSFLSTVSVQLSVDMQAATPVFFVKLLYKK